MKKVLFFAAILLFFSFALSAEKICFFTPHIDWHLSFSSTIEDSTEHPTLMVNPAVDFVLDMKEVYFGFSLRVNQNYLDFTFKNTYLPTFFEKLNIGLGTIFHIQDKPASFIQTDFLIGAFLKYRPCSWFRLDTSTLFLWKNSYIDIGGGDTFFLTNKNMAVDLQLYFYPIKTLALYLAFNSYDTFNYMLAMCPIFKVGVEYDFSKYIKAGVSVAAQYVDFFIVSAALNSLNYRAFIELKL